VTGETLSGFLPKGVELHGNNTLDLRGGVLLDAHCFWWIRVIPSKDNVNTPCTRVEILSDTRR